MHEDSRKDGQTRQRRCCIDFGHLHLIIETDLVSGNIALDQSNWGSNFEI